MAVYYWVGGSGTWNSITTINWAASSGGAGGAGVPTSTDDVLFDANSGTAATIVVTTTAATNSISINKSDINLSLSGNTSAGSASGLDFIQGTITLNNFTWSVFQFQSNYSNTRAIAFGTGNISMSSSTAALQMATATGFTCTGTGGFNITSGGASVEFGTTGGTASNAPNLSASTSGVGTSITTGSYFKNVIFDSAAFSSASGSYNACGNLTLSSNASGIYTSLVPTFIASGTITSNGRTINSITINGSGVTVTLADAFTASVAITLTQGTFTTSNFSVTASAISSSNANVRTINLGSSTVTLTSTSPVGFATSTNLTFNAGTSQINMSSASATTFAGNGLTYYNVAFTGTTAVTHVVTGANIFNNFTVTAPAATGLMQCTFAANQTINGTLTVAGATAVQRVFIRSNTFGTSRTLTAAALSATDGDFRDITIAGVASGSSPTRAGNCGGNSGITFPAAKTVYWNLAGAHNWSATGWAATSGGAPAINNFPLAQDSATFDNTGSVTGIISFDLAWNFGTIDMSARTTAMTLATSTLTPSIYGSWKNGTGTTLSGTGIISFNGRVTQQITGNGKSFTQPITVDNLTGTVQLQDAVTVATASTFTLTSGTLDLNGKTLTTGLFAGSGAVTRTLAFGIGNIACSGTGTVWTTATVTGLTVTGTPVVNVTYTSSLAISVLSGALSEANSISFNFKAGSYALTFLGTASYTAKSVNFTGYAGTWGATSTGTIYGDLTLSTGMTLTTSASAMTFGATSGTQTITNNTKTMDFPITVSGGSTVTCADALTLGATRALTFSLGTIQLKAGATSTVGSFVTSGTTLKYLQSTTSGTQATLSDASGTNTATYLSVQDSAATGGATWIATAATNVNAGNNTGWTFAATSTGNFFFMFG